MISQRNYIVTNLISDLKDALSNCRSWVKNCLVTIYLTALPIYNQTILLKPTVKSVKIGPIREDWFVNRRFLTHV